MLTAALFGAILLQGPTTPPPKVNQAPPVLTKQAKDEQQHQKDLDGDTEMGKKFCVEVEKTEKLSDNKAYQERVNRIGQEMAEIAHHHGVAVYLDGAPLNASAWSCSGGYAPAIALASAPATGALVSADFGVLWLCRFADDLVDFEEFMATLFALRTVKLQTVRP